MFASKLPKCHSIYYLVVKANYSTQHARVVIGGAGVVGNSVAYHLAAKGWTDVLVLEQSTIGSGSSHFGSGTLGLFKPIADRDLIWYSIKLYQELQQKGYDIEMKRCGSLNLAKTKDRLIALKRRIAYNVPTGLQCELLDSKAVKDLHPYLFTEDLEGAVWIPDDAVANPIKICHVLAKLAQEYGVRYKENVIIKNVLTKNQRVYAVRTNEEVIHCDYFINCAGMWARELGLQCNPKVRIPAYPAEHFYALTSNLNLEEGLPCVRDYDSNSYIRQSGSGFLLGWFEQEAKAAFDDHPAIPKNWRHYLQHDWAQFENFWKKSMHRIPMLSSCPQPRLINSPDNFTPDGRWILGEMPSVSNYFVACGMNGNSLQGAGGIGNAMAEWIIEGRPTKDLLPFHVQRYLDVHNGRQYLQQRIKEVVGRHYAILYPLQCEYKYARKVRCSPLFSVLETKGAVFGIKMAYERALYFDTTCGDKKPTMPPGSFYKPQFFNFMKEEHNACREGVGIIDMSSFSKIDIKSDRAEDVVGYLQKLCSNEVNIPIGSIVHTGMLNEHGGYENDCMLVRQEENSFFMVSPTSQQTRVYEWLTKNLSSKSTVALNDVTSMYTVLNVVGPKASELIGELSNSDMLLHSFTYKKVNVGYASDVMVMSFTHTGDPGYCLYIPSEYALHVYEKLMVVGRDYGVRDVGTLTQRFMRIERFIPFWAEELTSFTTPFEAGNGYNVRLDKKDHFIGKEALMKQKRDGILKQLVFFQLNKINIDVDIWPWGGEPIYRNGEFVGTVTSAGYGFSTNKLIALGFLRRPKDSQVKTVTTDYILSKQAKYEIDIAGNKFPATPYIHAPIFATTVSERRKYKPTAIRSKAFM
ncbi:PREDICTED: pyruvate dehydrogenase phosphatase regulatory subunit, mitochondrial-like [Nicrophorus vespilloides]|uniref:Pyruvate dehydrogenase phosphatase regulatory subunit, mitochondrial-like n=1 Tax=Nicrophorus vespilloides TaxID=110193 RepID=A0ABM1M7P8_NICVS|nr:PREDICTED: pyruvate dehydrogenase phosphatase regulatory subunit, mitochondrial-like [Nicrophorus vespilloides]XP_017770598.1 PREDICTED: pyruvate dehydrogenase phosphatase regulatory subunit, mitochondrial-like [Nicrophorus vespilloides]XP_017770599.1 PREDICTED: pyruvate dehydrogenase phosphatase regulatory subunit, mitochondrial-like [Nicrophorus vespilloides]